MRRALSAVAVASLALVATLAVRSSAREPIVQTGLPASAGTAAARLAESPRRAAWVAIRTGERDSVMAWVVYPQRSDKAPVVVAIHENTGINTWTRAVADQLAADGFIGIAPDLTTMFRAGDLTADPTPDAGRAAIGQVTPELGTRLLDAVARYGMALPEALPSWGVVGFCWGGARAFLQATASPTLGAAVVYYGSPPSSEQMAAIRAPVLGLYGGSDARINATIPATDSAMHRLGKAYDPHLFEGAGHGFLRAQDNNAANAAASAEAWPLTLAFLREHLGAAPLVPHAALSPTLAARFLQQSVAAEARGLAEPFRGVTTNGTVRQGLFPVRSTGVSTAPVREAAEAFLAALSPAQRAKTQFSVDHAEWRSWMNQHFYVRRGVGFDEMSAEQREAAFGLLRAGLSAKGLSLSRDIMRLNHTLGELNDNDFEQYGEWLYWITLMGTPSDTEPWGWQLDGHHLIINYFVQGDQVVMTPSFFGSEPVVATSGKYAGTAILQAEQDKGLAFMRSLDAAQRAQAIVRTAKTGNDNVGEAFKDNVVLDYAGLRATALSAAQREQLLDLVHEFVRTLRDPHARVQMDEVRRHLDETWFAWIGGTDTNGVFYYRIHSPVVLIEFDHQLPVGIRHLYPGERAPVRQHIHAVVRTPNGNDYGKDLLRQHYERHPHPHRH